MSDDEHSLEDIMWEPNDLYLTDQLRQPPRPPAPGPYRHYEIFSSTPSPTALESTWYPNEQEYISLHDQPQPQDPQPLYQIQRPIALRYHDPTSSVLCECKCLLHHSRERHTYDRNLVLTAESTSSACYFCLQASWALATSVSMEASQSVQEPAQRLEDAVRRNRTEPLPTHSAVSTNVEQQQASITGTLSHFQVPGNHMSI